MATNRDIDREGLERLGKGAGAFAAGFFALYVYPPLLGALLGGLAGALYPWRFGDDVDREWWRKIAGWSIGAGLAVAAAYFALDSVIGADVEWRRFNRQWGLGHLDPAALVAHPWAWLPLGSAVALIAAGVGILWRAR